MSVSELRIGDLCPRVPVIQGGMGVGVSLSGLAGAVAAAGGVGVISTAQIGYRDPDFARNPIECNLKAGGEGIPKTRSKAGGCLFYTTPSPRDRTRYRMPFSA